jgi:hypothetical protein
MVKNLWIDIMSLRKTTMMRVPIDFKVMIEIESSKRKMSCTEFLNTDLLNISITPRNDIINFSNNKKVKS